MAVNWAALNHMTSTACTLKQGKQRKRFKILVDAELTAETPAAQQNPRKAEKTVRETTDNTNERTDKKKETVVKIKTKSTSIE